MRTPPTWIRLGPSATGQNVRKIIDWSVRLAGAKSVLAALASAYRGPDPKVELLDERYYLRTAKFLQYTDSLDVINAADSLLRRMCGLLNLYGNYVGEVWAEGTLWTDANGNAGGTSSARGKFSVISREALDFLTARSEAHAKSRATEYYELSEREPAVKALLSVAGWKQMGWGDLYMVYEILRDACGGPEALARFARIDVLELRRFSDTANSYRHAGGRKQRLAAVPMHWDEATELMRHTARKWLEAKLP